MVESAKSSYYSRKRAYGECLSNDYNLSYPLAASKDTKAALHYLLSIFPQDMFGRKLPPIALKHQIYSIFEDRTLVDRELNSLRDAGEIRLIKLDSGSDEFAVVNRTDYMEIITTCVKERRLENDHNVNEFLLKILPKVKDVSVEKSKILKDFRLSDQVITTLMNLGILNLRDEKSLWISIPYGALFMKSLIAGRKAVLSIINKMKYKEIFQSELEKRDIRLHSKLGIVYHIHDIIGNDMVRKLSTTNGTLLRSTQSIKKQKKAKRR